MTPDGRRAVSGSFDQTLKVWDLGTGQAVATLEGHTDVIDTVAVTSDGRRAVSGSRDETLKVWDLVTGLSIASFHSDGSVTAVSIVNASYFVAGAGHGVHFLDLRD